MIKYSFILFCFLMMVYNEPYKIKTHLFSNEKKAIDFILDKASRFDKEIQYRYIEVVLKNSRKYKLDPLLIAKQINVEDHYRWWRTSSQRALGCLQIKPFFWSHLLYRIDGGNLGKHLLKNPNFKPNRYFLRIGYNIEMGCYILSNLNYVYGDYKIALLRYAYETDTFLKYRSNPDQADYIQKIYYSN